MNPSNSKPWNSYPFNHQIIIHQLKAAFPNSRESLPRKNLENIKGLKRKSSYLQDRKSRADLRTHSRTKTQNSSRSSTQGVKYILSRVAGATSRRHDTDRGRRRRTEQDECGKAGEVREKWARTRENTGLLSAAGDRDRAAARFSVRSDFWCTSARALAACSCTSSSKAGERLRLRAGTSVSLLLELWGILSDSFPEGVRLFCSPTFLLSDFPLFHRFGPIAGDFLCIRTLILCTRGCEIIFKVAC